MSPRIFRDPLTIAVAAGVVTGGAGIAQKIIGAEERRKEGRRARRAAEAEAAELEKQIESRQELLLAEERERSRRVQARQRAAFGAAGIEPTGLPFIVQLDEVMTSLRRGEAIIAGLDPARADIRFRRTRAREISRSTRIPGATLLTGIIGDVAGTVGSIGQVAAIGKGAA